MDEPDELTEVLRAGNHGLRVTPEARSRHSDAISAELERHPITATAEVMALAPLPGPDLLLGPVEEVAGDPPPAGPDSWIDRLPGGGRHLWLAPLAAAAVLLVGVYMAAANSLPGDPLYSVKRASENILAMADHDLPADNRLDELEVLIDRSAGPTRIVEAQRAVGAALSRLDDGDQEAARYGTLAIGVPDAAGQLDPTYRVVLVLGPSPDRRLAVSLPNGDILSLSAVSHAPPSIEITGEWWVVATDRGRWEVSGQLTPTGPPGLLDITLDGDQVELVLIGVGDDVGPETTVQATRYSDEPLDVDDAILVDPSATIVDTTVPEPVPTTTTTTTTPPTTTTVCGDDDCDDG